ncbi:unnamed protein product, partial [Owenia fusiformis]
MESISGNKFEGRNNVSYGGSKAVLNRESVNIQLQARPRRTRPKVNITISKQSNNITMDSMRTHHQIRLACRTGKTGKEEDEVFFTDRKYSPTIRFSNSTPISIPTISDSSEDVCYQVHSHTNGGTYKAVSQNRILSHGRKQSVRFISPHF